MSWNLLEPKNGWRRGSLTIAEGDYWVTVVVWVSPQGDLRIPQVTVEVRSEHFGPTKGDANSSKDLDVTTTALRVPIGDYRQRVAQLIQDDPGRLSPAAFEAQFAQGLLQRGDIPDAQRRMLARVASYGALDLGDVTTLAKSLRVGPKMGRGAKDPAHYRDTARMYLALYPEHGQRVVKVMAEEMGRPRHTVRTWVRRAREEGWLGKGIQGKAGGGPGPRLREWLREQEQ
jgi:hypothetical protein